MNKSGRRSSCFQVALQMILVNRLFLNILIAIHVCALSFANSKTLVASLVPIHEGGKDDVLGVGRSLLEGVRPCRDDSEYIANIGRQKWGCRRARRGKYELRQEPLEFTEKHYSNMLQKGDSICMSMDTIKAAYMISSGSTDKGTLASQSSSSVSDGGPHRHDNGLPSQAATTISSRENLRIAAPPESRRTINVLILDFHYGMRREMESIISNFRAENLRYHFNVYSPPDPEIIICETRGLDIWAFCGESEIEHFLKLAQEKPWLRNADVVMFSMPPVTLQLFLRLNKAIVMLVAVPPEYGRQNLQAYERWHADLRRAATLPHMTIVSCSVYDFMYLRYYYGIETEVIPVLGEYKGKSGLESPPKPRVHDDRAIELKKGRFASTGVAERSPHRPPTSIGLFPQSSWNLDWPQIKVLSGLRNYEGSFAIVETTGKLKDAIDLSGYDALINLPYMRNTNLFIEAYRAVVPIFTPSLKYLVQLDQAHCLMSNRVYWTNIPEPCDPAYPYSPAELAYSEYPVVTEPRSHEFWLAYSQQFRPDHPGVLYFDSPEDLEMKLMTADLDSTRATMRQANSRALRDVNILWKKILTRLFDGIASVPGNSTGLQPFTGPTSVECNKKTFQKYFDRTRTLDNSFCPRPMALDIKGMPGRHSCGLWESIPY